MSTEEDPSAVVERPYAKSIVQPRYMTAEEVSKLSPEARVQRVRHLVRYGHDLVDQVVREEQLKTWRRPKSEDDEAAFRRVVGEVILFSGGNDSTTLAHMFKDRATAAAHANTTIGIEQTRQYVRDTCSDWGLPLVERVAPISYRDLVVEQGFPGPGHHWKMYQRLKERPLRQVRKEFVKTPRRERVIFLAGRRRDESARRRHVPEVEYDTGVGASVVWVSPLVWWTKPDLNTYRMMFPDVPRNEVSDLLHMSGECLCGSFAKPDELDEIDMWFPETAAEIRSIEAQVQAAGKHPISRSRWGHRKGSPTDKVGMMCSSCSYGEEDDKNKEIQ